MEIFSALLASVVEIHRWIAYRHPHPHSKGPVTQIFDVFIDVCLNKRLNKQWRWSCGVSVMIKNLQSTSTYNMTEKPTKNEYIFRTLDWQIDTLTPQRTDTSHDGKAVILIMPVVGWKSTRKRYDIFVETRVQYCYEYTREPMVCPGPRCVKQ